MCCWCTTKKNATNIWILIKGSLHFIILLLLLSMALNFYPILDWNQRRGYYSNLVRNGWFDFDGYLFVKELCIWLFTWLDFEHTFLSHLNATLALISFALEFPRNFPSQLSKVGLNHFGNNTANFYLSLCWQRFNIISFRLIQTTPATSFFLSSPGTILHA